jgi:hypothetical protein
VSWIVFSYSRSFNSFSRSSKISFSVFSVDIAAVAAAEIGMLISAVVVLLG